jgi:ketosteroid isomerase-like protein
VKQCRQFTEYFRRRLVKKWILFCAVVTLIAGSSLAQTYEPPRGSGQIWGRSPGPPAPGPLVNLVQAGVDAYNKGDIGYFEKVFADDILWVDEDGHELTSKMFAVWFIGRQMNATPKRKMSVHGVATGAWADTGWAAFAYTIDDGVNQRKGMNTTLFRKVGEDWKIVVMHGSIDAKAIPH